MLVPILFLLVFLLCFWLSCFGSRCLRGCCELVGVVGASLLGLSWGMLRDASQRAIFTVIYSVFCTFPKPILTPKSLQITLPPHPPMAPANKRLSVSNAFRHHPAPPIGASWDYVGANLVLAGVLVVLLVVLFRFSLS